MHSLSLEPCLGSPHTPYRLLRESGVRVCAYRHKIAHGGYVLLLHFLALVDAGGILTVASRERVAEQGIVHGDDAGVAPYKVLSMRAASDENGSVV